ncbi:nuclear transport factor 2 family protein [Levilactobacillus fujinensis]|uniref:Nuclear transport factor 2 family protein n=1 Tax=Levilactobacillus fujinensis TaxID=2486024 RepID=A0ABW1TJM2_9LACO|nr:nuclear transport factor 2 family protein [Levilactobacillus fujinensis]
MDQRVEIIKRYFEFSDSASSDEQARDAIVNLFSDIAVVKGANGFVADTSAKITSFFAHFFKDNQELRHLCQVSVASGNYKAEWAVAGRKSSGKLFAFHGFDTYQFDQDDKITYLQVEIRD